MFVLAMDFWISIISFTICDYISIFIVSILLEDFTIWENAKVNFK
jgi:hypothetical protein